MPEENDSPFLLDKHARGLPNLHRMARYAADPRDRAGVSPMTVATVVAGVVKRYLRNPARAEQWAARHGTFHPCSR